MEIDYVKPVEVMAEVVQAGKTKAALPIRDMLVRGLLASVFLGYATSLAVAIQSQGLPPFIGAAVFPIGIGMIVILGLELATGSFASLPIAMAARQVRLGGLSRNWGWVYLSNLIGGILYAFLFYIVITKWGTTDGGTLGEQVRQLAEKKTLGFAAAGAAGWGAALISGILCNWLVALGAAVLPFASRSTIGKLAALWLPIMTFFALGYEHSIVNAYLIPAGIFMGAPISLGDWWLWNQIPVTIGNIIGGAIFTGMALTATYGGYKKGG